MRVLRLNIYFVSLSNTNNDAISAHNLILLNPLYIFVEDVKMYQEDSHTSCAFKGSDGNALCFQSER